MPDSASVTRSAPGDDGSSGAPRHSGLLLVAGDGLLATFELVGEESIIGRDAECNVVVDHPTLSRRHVRLRLGTPITIEDLGSKNGTHLGERRLEPHTPVALPFGDAFGIGRLSFVVIRSPVRTQAVQGRTAEALRVVDPTADGVGALIRDIAHSNVSVLILGETGVGKEILASTIHQHSGRKGAFVRINCAAIAPALIESELFGHVRGAFTGATQERVGLLEAADGGTVFLDEVGDLPETTQAKLLRAIETREVLRVGAVRPTNIDVRFVAATNRDLPKDVAEGRFRDDLFFRLDGVTLVIPPLRERRESIRPLALEFLHAAHDKRSPSEPLRLAPDLLAHLESRDWPGNVRELKAALERALLLARGREIAPRHVAPSAIPTSVRTTRTAPAAAPAPAPAPPLSPSEATERQRILEALEANAGNQTRAAKALGISRATLVNRLALYRIPRPRK